MKLTNLRISQWKRCELYSQGGIYNAGFVLTGTPKDTEDYALEKVCPSKWGQIPIGGTYYLTLNLLQDQGGPSFLDKFLMAEDMISRTYEAKWPNCSVERIRQGYPKIIETQEGVFDWETPCQRCKIHTP